MRDSALTGRWRRKTPTEVFMRLYTLRNQLIHGGATWNSAVNRAHVRDCRTLLTRILSVKLGGDDGQP